MDSDGIFLIVQNFGLCVFFARGRIKVLKYFII